MVIKSIDGLGRNYTEILEEWRTPIGGHPAKIFSKNFSPSVLFLRFELYIGIKTVAEGVTMMADVPGKEIGHPFPKTVSLPCECCLFLASHPEFVKRIRKEAMRHAAELTVLRAMGL